MNIQPFTRTPLLRCSTDVFGRTLYVKDESACPTRTFKDRLGWALIRQLEHSPVKNLLITCITLGNTLRSLTHFLRQQPITDTTPQVLGLFPLGFSARKIGPDSDGRVCLGSDLIRLYETEGAITAEVDLESSFLDEKSIMHLARRLAPEFEHHRDVSYGIGEAAYAPILEEALKELITSPAIIIVPVGSGVLFEECIDVVESHGLSSCVVGVSVLHSQSIADKIYGYYSPYFKQLRRKGRAVHEQHLRHSVIAVKDDDILEALEWVSFQGYEAEASAAAALVPLLKNLDWLPPGDALWINTGNGIALRK